MLLTRTIFTKSFCSSTYIFSSKKCVNLSFKIHEYLHKHGNKDIPLYCKGLILPTLECLGIGFITGMNIYSTGNGYISDKWFNQLTCILSGYEHEDCFYIIEH